MIELNNKTQQDFLNREWVQRLLDAGIDLSDAKYIIAKDKLSMHDEEPDLTDYIWYKDSTEEVYDVCPTLSVSEILAMLPEEASIVAKGIEYKGGLKVIKAHFQLPWFIAMYDLHNIIDHTKGYCNLYSESKYLIEALASLLVKLKTIKED